MAWMDDWMRGINTDVMRRKEGDGSISQMSPQQGTFGIPEKNVPSNLDTMGKGLLSGGSSGGFGIPGAGDAINAINGGIPGLPKPPKGMEPIGNIGGTPVPMPTPSAKSFMDALQEYNPFAKKWWF